MQQQTKRSNPSFGFTFKESIGCGSAFFTVNFSIVDGEVFLSEVFSTTSGGGCTSNTKEIGRLVSLCLQHSVPIESILDQLDSEICPTARHRAGKDQQFQKSGNHSCSKALASAIRKALHFRGFVSSHQDEIESILTQQAISNVRSALSAVEDSDISLFLDEEGYEVDEDINSPPISKLNQNIPIKESKVLLTQSSQPKITQVNQSDLTLKGLFKDKSEDTSVPVNNYFISPDSQPVTSDSKSKLTKSTIRHILNKEELTVDSSNNKHLPSDTCPECASPLFRESGCVICKFCGYSHC